MSATTAFGALLAAVSGLTALVGSRIYAFKIPQRTPGESESSRFPQTTFFRVSDVPARTMGQNEAGVRTIEGTWQVDHWGVTAAAARGASDALFTGLDGYSARAPGAGEAYRAVCENTSDDYEPDTELYRVTQFWRVWHRE